MHAAEHIPSHTGYLACLACMHACTLPTKTLGKEEEIERRRGEGYEVKEERRQKKNYRRERREERKG
jgi:hypothetical protein